MSGICGWIQLNGKIDIQTSTAWFEPMNASLTHRGPDDRGAVVFDDAVLGMTRLSIIDIEGGQQPIANEAEDCWIVFNGEIYNVKELRDTLKGRGCHFRTRSDAEVILRAYEEWGFDCVRRLRGMFAFAICDRRRANGHQGKATAPSARLFLARDRVGEKPLFYFLDEEQLIFGSEIKAILAHPGVRPRVNRAVVPLYFTYGYVPSPATFFEDIYELAPGHTAIVEDGSVSVSRYWELPRDPVIEPVHSEAEYFHEVRAHFEDAVRSRLVSDVPLGAFLSGEIDSAAVVAVMTRLLGHSVSTFAIGFADEPSFNELKYARLVAQQFGADHHEFIVKPDVIELLPKLVWHYDQPFADSSALPIYYVAQLAREHVKVALTGDGGDELFVGYERFAAARMAEFHRRTPPILRGAVSRLVHALPESTSYFGLVRRARQFVERASLPLPERYLEWVGIFKPDFLHELLLDSTEIDTAGHLRGYFDARQAANPIAQLLTLNMASDSLVKMDRMTMANSLEARCPFLDDQLLARASKIPSQLKLKGMTTNYILKRAFEGILPREIVRRKKHGFGVPVGRWFRAGLKDFLCDTILSPEALQRGYFREPVVRTLVGEHMSGKRDHGHRLWALLTFEIWHRLFIDQGVSPWFPDLTKPRPGSYGSPARIRV